MPKTLSTAHVARMLKARGLKATPDEIQQLTSMMNEDQEREAKAAALKAQSKALDRFMAQFAVKEMKPKPVPRRRSGGKA